MLLLIRLGKFNYFFSKTFRLSLHGMIIWKIRAPNIFQVFKELDKNFSVASLT